MKTPESDRKFSQEFVKVVKALWWRNNTVEPQGFFKELGKHLGTNGNVLFQKYVQYDAHEFLNFMLSKLSDELCRGRRSTVQFVDSRVERIGNGECLCESNSPPLRYFAQNAKRLEQIESFMS
jgi:ubiquitin C-terminal hydrolase